MEPTCIEEGYTDYSCILCAYGYEDMILPALGHDWGLWASNKDGTHTRICKRDPSHKENENCKLDDRIELPSCTEGGYTRHTCSICAYLYDDTSLPALGHDWQAWQSHEDRHHSRICNRNAQHIETNSCQYRDAVTPATCTRPGFTTHQCTSCAYAYSDGATPALGHDWGPWENNEDGTHTRTCKRDASHKETEKCMLDATLEPPTCIEDGYTDYDCSVCGYGYMDVIVPASGHQPGAWHKVLKPTRYASGKEEQRCAVCDVLLQEQTMPKLSGIRYGNTACIDGPHFRDSIPEVTDKWYSYAVIDLEKEGVTEYPLIASNQYRIGSVFVTVSKSDLMVRYQFSIRKYELREEFLAFFSTLDNIRTLDIEKLKADTLIFNQPTALSELPQENGKTILFMRLLLNYDSFDQGIAPR